MVKLATLREEFDLDDLVLEFDISFIFPDNEDGDKDKLVNPREFMVWIDFQTQISFQYNDIRFPGTWKPISINSVMTLNADDDIVKQTKYEGKTTVIFLLNRDQKINSLVNTLLRVEYSGMEIEAQHPRYFQMIREKIELRIKEKKISELQN